MGTLILSVFIFYTNQRYKDIDDIYGIDMFTYNYKKGDTIVEVLKEEMN